jgi:hypothetical protein
MPTCGMLHHSMGTQASEFGDRMKHLEAIQTGCAHTKGKLALLRGVIPACGGD